jgi:hypothetical protein
MNNRSKFTKDWEILSAYLDGELSDPEMDRIAVRLRDDRGLRGLLNELKRTRGLLRSLPEQKSPRNFVLTEEMVGIKKAKRRLYPVFGLASALAGLMFVLMIFAESLGLGITPDGQINLPGFQTPALERAVEPVAGYQGIETEKSIQDSISPGEAMEVVVEAETVLEQVESPAEAIDLVSPLENLVSTQPAIEPAQVTNTISIGSGLPSRKKQ